MRFLPLSILCLAPCVCGQSLNLRFTDWTPPPSPGYGAVTGQTGVWNALQAPSFFGIVNSTVDLAGNPTVVTVEHSGCDAFTCNVSGYGPDVQALFAGSLNADCFATSSTTLKRLEPGPYVLTALNSPCWGGFDALKLQLSDHSYAAELYTGGGYFGSFDDMTVATFSFTVDFGVTVEMSSSKQGYLSAVQLARIEPPDVYCTSKVNSQGCAAQIAAIGNTGSLSNSAPFHVVASDVVDDVWGLLFYGIAADVQPFLGGLLCVQAPILRTEGQFSGGNGVPCAGTFDLDVNAWLDTDPSPKVFGGTRLYAQYWYRDPADPFGAATSDAVSF
ncbi:MAG TPA: hypothetical protein VN759_00470, partial [Pseudolysinimonas sp.]|nr:hypothetical protein [Pseudolysinimonas sp.]